MPGIAVSGARILVTPTNGWSWGPSWLLEPGKIDVNGTADRYKVAGRPAAFESDLLEALERELKGRGYITPDFPIEGKVGQVSAIVTGEATAGNTVGKRKLGMLGTKGRLKAVASPSASNPVGQHGGMLEATWEVVDAGQTIAFDSETRPAAAGCGGEREPASAGDGLEEPTRGESFTVAVRFELDDAVNYQMLRRAFPRGIQIDLAFAQMRGSTPVVSRKTVFYNLGALQPPMADPPAEQQPAVGWDAQRIEIPLGELSWETATEFVAAGANAVGLPTHVQCKQIGLPFLAFSPNGAEFHDVQRHRGGRPRWRDTYGKILSAGGRSGAPWRLTAALNGQPNNDKALSEWAVIYVPQRVELVRGAEVTLTMALSFPRLFAIVDRTEQLERELDRLEISVARRAERVKLAALIDGLDQTMGTIFSKAAAVRDPVLGRFVIVEEDYDAEGRSAPPIFLNTTEMLLQLHEFDLIERLVPIMANATALRELLPASFENGFCQAADEEYWRMKQGRSHGVLRPDLEWLAQAAKDETPLPDGMLAAVAHWMVRSFTHRNDTSPLRAISAAIRAFEALHSLKASLRFESQRFKREFPRADEEQSAWKDWLQGISVSLQASLGSSARRSFLVDDLRAFAFVTPLSLSSGIKAVAGTTTTVLNVKGAMKSIADIFHRRGIWLGKLDELDMSWLKSFEGNVFAVREGRLVGVPYLGRLRSDLSDSLREGRLRGALEKKKPNDLFSDIDVIFLPIKIAALSVELSEAKFSLENEGEREKTTKVIGGLVSMISDISASPKDMVTVATAAGASSGRAKEALGRFLALLKSAQKIGDPIHKVAGPMGRVFSIWSTLLAVERQTQSGERVDAAIGLVGAAIGVVELVALLSGVTLGIVFISASVSFTVLSLLAGSVVFNPTQAEIALRKAIGTSEFGKQGLAERLRSGRLQRPLQSSTDVWSDDLKRSWGRAYLELKETETSSFIRQLESAVLSAIWKLEADHYAIDGSVVGRLSVRPRLAMSRIYRAAYLFPADAKTRVELELTVLPKADGKLPFETWLNTAAAINTSANGGVKLVARVASGTPHRLRRITPYLDKETGNPRFTISLAPEADGEGECSVAAAADFDLSNGEVSIVIGTHVGEAIMSSDSRSEVGKRVPVRINALEIVGGIFIQVTSDIPAAILTWEKVEAPKQ
ncbi:hypothetical protein [Bradyrhizobium sp. sGM-13]|uniref:hypothetical protein n=1 Tax=Bradyrhizobium sp. sGM-13 TaxID=2831781 RepID=UPI001BCD9812|nr:hypothetical protein [Bradyrhizobium sp. sGM-13]